MNASLSEFSVSQREIDRRIGAFTIFIFSLALGAVSAATPLIVDNPLLSVAVLSSFLVVFLLFRLLIFRFFQSLLKIKIFITGKFVERTAKSRDRIPLSDIKSVHIRETAEGKIREIQIVLSDGHTLFIDGLEHFDQFTEKLVATCGKNVVLQESTERIPYDHPLFYWVLGILVGSAAVHAIRLVASLEYAGTQIAVIGFAAYISILGLYFSFGTPLFVRYGGKARSVDYALGLLLLCAGAGILLLAM